MSSSTNQTDISSQDDDDDVPVAMFVCLGVGGYLILVIVIIVVYRSLKGQGSGNWKCSNCGSCCQFGMNNKSCSCKSCQCCVNCNVSSCFSGFCSDWKCCGETTCPSCSGCCTRCNSSWPSCSVCSNCCESITSCCPSCSSEDEGCVCMCLEIKVHKIDNEDKSYRDVSGTVSSDTVGVDDTGQLCSTHSPPQRYLVDGVPSKQQRIHQQRGFDGPVISDVTFVEGTFTEKDRNLNSRSVKIASPRGNHSTYSEHPTAAHFGSKSTNNHIRSQRQLPCPSENENDRTSASTNKSSCNGSTDLSSSLGNNRHSSRVCRSLHAGRRSQRYPNKFLVNSDAFASPKEEGTEKVHKGNTRDMSMKRKNFEISDTTQSGQLSPSALSGKQSSYSNSKALRSGQTKHMLSTSPRRVLPTPKGFQSL